MKTEPREALRAMANDLKYNTGVVQSNIKLVIEESFISGVKYGQSSPKIKQLEWTFAKNEGFAFTPFVNYRIYYWKTAYNENKVQLIYNKNSNAALNGHDGHELIGEYDDCDSAIRAAQTDFEKRVKECLE